MERFQKSNSIDKFGWSHSILWGLLLLSFAAAYFPVWSGLIKLWAGSDDYSHGFAIVPLAIYVLWQKREDLGKEPAKGSWAGLLLAFAALLIYIVAKKGEMQTLASVSMVFFFWGAVLFLFGTKVFKKCLFPLAILFFMIPVPSQIIAALTIPLQLIVTKASVWAASLIGVPILSEGNVIQLPGRTFQVVQACSGLRSIMAMMTLGAILAYFTLRSNALRGTLFLFAVPIAIAVNILRVFVLVVVYNFLSIDLSEGSVHTVMGIAIFAVAILLFLATRKGLALCER